jgi:hypothetical protein
VTQSRYGCRGDGLEWKKEYGWNLDWNWKNIQEHQGRGRGRKKSIADILALYY